MEIKHNKIKGHHTWVLENMKDEDGIIYGCNSIHYQIKVNGEYVGDVFEGEFKANAHDRKNNSNISWWASYKDGKLIGSYVKSRKKAIENLIK
jgi:hypothetical protein